MSTISSLLLKNSTKNISDAGSVSKRDKVNKEILEETTSEIAYSIGVPERRTKEEVINKLRKFAKKDVRMEYI